MKLFFGVVAIGYGSRLAWEHCPGRFDGRERLANRGVAMPAYLRQIAAGDAATLPGDSASARSSWMIVHGKLELPRIRGMPITVGDLLEYLPGGMSEEQLLPEIPSSTRFSWRASSTPWIASGLGLNRETD